ncbi:MAG: CinA family protein [Clostridia bacterium]|nr:CinA family protein [Clostridia bacterium]
MITLLCNEYTESVAFVKGVLDDNLIPCTLTIGDDQTISTHLSNAVKSSRAVVLCGNYSYKNLVASTFGLAMNYDKFAEKNVEKLCTLTKQPMPPQYLLDSLCSLPETFVHYTCNFCTQSACFGEISKTGIFVLPNNLYEVKFVADTYFLPFVKKIYPQTLKLTYKIFGLQNKEVVKAVADLATLKLVVLKCTTVNLDSKLTLTFTNSATRQLVDQVNKQIVTKFGSYMYSSKDESLQQVVVQHLKQVQKRIAVAESLTGGQVCAKLVEVPGVSSVLYEGLVTYSIASKCNRLGVSPHLVDTYGVVSREVAESMAKGIK